MPRTVALVLATGFLLAVAACSSQDGTVAAPSQDGAVATPSAAPSSGEPGGLVMEPAVACEAADAAYHSLGPGARAQIVKGVTAEAKGDTTGVKEALAALKPLFTSTSATFADTASKVTDPALKEALMSLSETAAKEATFTSFVEFDSLAAMTAPAEATLKQKCADAGYPMKNIE
ncbi:hypothetical protein [Micromonospora sp. NPDC050200]|uniref:hypothetical protein n=1 Tax=Micromonospora sp. NPDC050200 TaxID=3155664 RepID=UPI0033DC78BB